MVNNKKFLVNEMTKEAKDKVKLKAMRLGISIDELTLKAIDAFECQTNCYCGKENSSRTDFVHEFYIADRKVNVTVANTPLANCESCSQADSPYFNLKLVAMIEGIVEKKILKGLRKNPSLTDYTFDYEQLEKIE